MKEAIVKLTFWVLKSHLFKALVLPTSIYGFEMFGANFKNLSHYKVDHFPSLKEETNLPPPQGYTITQGQCSLQHLSTYLRIAIETRQWSPIPCPRDTKLYHFCSYNAIQNNEHLPIREEFSSLLENAVLGSLKSFWQLDHQVDINLYPTDTTSLRPSRELASLKP